MPSALETARAIGYPVVLKTAEPGIHHKSDVDGVRLTLLDAETVLNAHKDLTERIGPKVTVEPMIAAGIKLAFGITAENSHQPFRRREGAMVKFRDIKTLQKFAAVSASIHNHFAQERHLSHIFKQNRAAALAEWRQLAA